MNTALWSLLFATVGVVSGYFHLWWLLLFLLALQVYLFWHRSRNKTLLLGQENQWQEISDALYKLSDPSLSVRLYLEGDMPGRASEAFNFMAEIWEERTVALSEENTRLETILAHMGDGVMLFDRKKRAILLNPSMETMVQLGRGDGMGRHHLEIFRDYTLDAVLDQVFEQRLERFIELRLQGTTERVLEAHVSPIFTEGRGVTGAILVARDVSETRRLERMRTDFVANVTHELQTPLTSIRGFAETLMDGGVEDAAVRLKFLGIIYQEAERLDRLIGDLLDLSKIEAGRKPPRLEEMDLHALVQEIVAHYAPRATKLALRLRFESNTDEVLLRSDPDQIRQIVTNLLSNAVKYTPKNGEIVVRLFTEEKGIRLEVEDSGTGIPKDDLSRVFERFYRVDKARSRDSGGTGLGLSIVKHLVEGLGGQVGVQSDLGKGSTFWVRLPWPQA